MGNLAQPTATTGTPAAELMAEALVRLGVRHVFGVGGANIEDMFLAVQRRRPRMVAILGKHEHSAGTAADAYARVSQSLGVVMTTSGGGAMNVVSALAESLASRVPVLAIIGEPPTNVQGRGAFQDTSGRGGAVDVQTVVRGVSAFCERATRAPDLPGLVDTAARIALEKSAPAVLLVAKDLQQARVDRASVTESIEGAGRVHLPDPAVIAKAGRVLTNRPAVIVAGDEVARIGAQPDLERLAAVLEAQVTVTPDGRDAFDNRDPRFAGVTGAMGDQSAADALANARICVLVGTRLPLLARQGHEAILRERARVSIARDEPFIASRDAVHIGGNLVASIRALLSELEHGRYTSAKLPTQPPTLKPADIVSAESDLIPFGSAAILGMIERSLPEDAVVLVDAGNTGAHAIHHLRAPHRGHWLVAMGMAGMGYTFGGAIGAACATGRRTLVLAGDGAFFMHGLDIHTAVEHQLPITYVIFNNRAHGMCLLRERLLLGEEAGYNVFRASNIGAGLAAMFPGLASSDCHSLADVERAIARSAVLRAPSVICAHLQGVDVPPFAPFRTALAARAAASKTGTLP